MSAQEEPLLSLRGVRKEFAGRGMGHPGSTVLAVDDVSLDVYPVETLGLVGESGCGKTTLARLILRLVDATAGEIRFGGRDLLKLSQREMLSVRQDLQVVLQDPAKYTLPIGLANMIGLPEYQTNYGILMAGTLLSILPVAILFFALQREFVAGLATGAVKG